MKSLSQKKRNHVDDILSARRRNVGYDVTDDSDEDEQETQVQFHNFSIESVRPELFNEIYEIADNNTILPQLTENSLQIIFQYLQQPKNYSNFAFHMLIIYIQEKIISQENVLQLIFNSQHLTRNHYRLLYEYIKSPSIQLICNQDFIVKSLNYLGQDKKFDHSILKFLNELFYRWHMQLSDSLIKIQEFSLFTENYFTDMLSIIRNYLWKSKNKALELFASTYMQQLIDLFEKGIFRSAILNFIADIFDTGEIKYQKAAGLFEKYKIVEKLKMYDQYDQNELEAALSLIAVLCFHDPSSYDLLFAHVVEKLFVIYYNDVSFSCKKDIMLAIIYIMYYGTHEQVMFLFDNDVFSIIRPSIEFLDSNGINYFNLSLDRGLDILIEYNRVDILEQICNDDELFKFVEDTKNKFKRISEKRIEQGKSTKFEEFYDNSFSLYCKLLHLNDSI